MFYLSKNEKAHTDTHRRTNLRRLQPLPRVNTSRVATRGLWGAKGKFNVALICGNRALNAAIFKVKLLELFDVWNCKREKKNLLTMTRTMTIAMTMTMTM